MISNKNVVKYKVVDLLKYYSLRADHFSIRDHLFKKNKLFIETLRLG
jgi:hypothetical protein